MTTFEITVTVDARSAAEAAGKIIYDAHGEPVTDLLTVGVKRLTTTKKLASGAYAPGGEKVYGAP